MVSGSVEGKKGFRLGVSGKMILNFAVPTATILILLAVIITVTVVNTVWGLKNEDIENQMQAVSNQVTQYFEPYFSNEQFILNDTSIKKLFDEVENEPAAYRFDTSEGYRQAMEQLQYADTVGGDAVLGVWIAGVKNSQVIQSDGYVSDASFDVTERIWYQLLTESGGESILTPVYVDTITGEMVVTVATPYTNASGSMIGVIGIDLSLDHLMDYFSQISVGESGYITVYDSDRNIIYHPDSSVLLRNLSEVDYSENMRSLLENNQNSDVVSYKRGGANYYGGTRYIDAYSWTVLACMPGSEYMQETTIVFIMLVVGFLFCILITSLICFVRTRALLRPLQTIGVVAEEFAKGNLDSDIHRSTNDEIGDLEEVFSHTQSNLKAIISDIAMVLRGISHKDLTVRTSAVYQGDFVEIQESLRGITAAMNDTMTQVRVAASQVDANSTQVSNGAQALAQGATQQASSVQELSATAQEISNKITQTAERADLAKTQTLAAKDSLDESDQKMQKLVVAMNQIKEKSGQIHGIIKTIDDIAFQTNILALNAAVEAARAGTAGKGFAVVADEVRNLASKSAEASRTTQELIEASIEAVETGNELVTDAAKDLEKTAEEAGKVMDSIAEIAQTSIEEAQAVHNVTMGLDQISSVVQTNAATAQESAASSEELSGQASMLQNLMAQFKLFEASSPSNEWENMEQEPEEQIMSHTVFSDKY